MSLCPVKKQKKDEEDRKKAQELAIEQRKNWIKEQAKQQKDAADKKAKAEREWKDAVVKKQKKDELCR